MFRCKKCYSLVNPEDAFCKNCGRILGDENKIAVMQESEGSFKGEQHLEKTEEYGEEAKKKENKRLIIKDVKVIAVIIISLLALLYGSYLVKAMISKDQSTNEVNTSSSFAHFGKLTYFSYGRMVMGTPDITGAFYSFSESNTVPQEFSDEVGSQVKVKDNWLYFINVKDKGSLYRMRTNGTEKMRLTDESTGVYDLKLFGDHLYFKDSYEGYNLCRINLDGSSKESISDDVLSYYFQGEKIYYFSGSELGTLYEMRTDGSDNKKVAKIAGPISYISDNYIYYNKLDSELFKNNNLSHAQQYYKGSYGPLYRVRKDGTKDELVIDDRISNIYVRSNHIYYKPFTEPMSTEVYRVDLDGKNKTKLKLEGIFLGIMDKWIYFSNPEDNELLRTTLDLKKTQKIETDIFKPAAKK